MSQGVQEYPCTICGQGGHRATYCKELAPPAPDGFYKPAPGGHQHDEDEEEHIARIINFYRSWYQNVLRINQSKRSVLP